MSPSPLKSGENVDISYFFKIGGEEGGFFEYDEFSFSEIFEFYLERLPYLLARLGYRLQ